ncbi:class I SAM-dependent methyltransferase [soil metagenome]
MNIPDWQLPAGVDRGLWDYLRSEEMVAGYDAQINVSLLARSDVAFCERHFPTPGRLLDLGTGTGRLCVHFAARGFDCVGVDLSEVMLAQAKRNDVEQRVKWTHGNICELTDLANQSFDYVACLFSTLGMVRSAELRQQVIANAFRLLKPSGVFVLHVHNRWFKSLGLKRFRKADHAMPQAYGGAPLTLHHFTKGETSRMLTTAGFRVYEVLPLGVETGVSPGWWPYGYLFSATRSDDSPHSKTREESHKSVTSPSADRG